MENLNHENSQLSLEEVNQILSETLKKVVDRKISLKQAGAISKLANGITKIITATDLKNRIELLEQILKKKK
jgi:hypothetical protein